MLGDGNIGRVYTADYTGSKDGRTFTACVAVKAIIEKASNQQIQDFVREAETRANFKHENVIALLGKFTLFLKRLHYVKPIEQYTVRPE